MKQDRDDTTPAAHRAQMAALSRLGPAGRLKIAVSMSEQARSMALEGILRRNPALTRHEAIITLAALLYGKDLAMRVWGAAAARCLAESEHAQPATK